MESVAPSPEKVAGHVFEGVGSDRRCVEPNCAALSVFWDDLKRCMSAEIGKRGWSHDGLTLSEEEYNQFVKECERVDRIAKIMIRALRS